MSEYSKNRWGWFLFFGTLMTATGVCAITLPLVFTVAVEQLVAWLFLIAGVFSVAQAFSARSWGGFLPKLIIGAFYGLAGFLMIAHPLAGIVSLTTILAATIAANGVVKLVLGLRLHPNPGWGWLLVEGVASMLFGAVILSGLGSASFVVLGMLAGVYLIFDGVGTAFLAIEMKVQGPETVSCVEFAGQ